MRKRDKIRHTLVIFICILAVSKLKYESLELNFAIGAAALVLLGIIIYELFAKETK